MLSCAEQLKRKLDEMQPKLSMIGKYAYNLMKFREIFVLISIVLVKY